MTKQLTLTPERPATHAALPEALDALIMRCLAKDPAERPQSARELGEELLAILVPRPVAAVPAAAEILRTTTTLRGSAKESEHEAPAAPPARRWPVIAALVAAGLVMGVGAAYLAQPGKVVLPATTSSTNTRAFVPASTAAAAPAPAPSRGRARAAGKSDGCRASTPERARARGRSEQESSIRRHQEAPRPIGQSRYVASAKRPRQAYARRDERSNHGQSVPMRRSIVRRQRQSWPGGFGAGAWLGLSVLLLSMAGVGSAWGETATQPGKGEAPSPAAKLEARERFDRGLRLFEKGDNASALAEFKRANELVPNPLVLYNMGLVYAAMNRPVESVDALGAFLAQATHRQREQRRRATETRDEQETRIARLTVQTQTPATVDVDGIEVGQTPLPEPIRVASGAHVVGAQAPGFLSTRKEIFLAGQTATTVVLTLLPAANKLAQLAVSSSPVGAEVEVNGNTVGVTPLSASVAVSPGEVRVVLPPSGLFAPSSARSPSTTGRAANWPSRSTRIRRPAIHQGRASPGRARRGRGGRRRRRATQTGRRIAVVARRPARSEGCAPRLRTLPANHQHGGGRRDVACRRLTRHRKPGHATRTA